MADDPKEPQGKATDGLEDDAFVLDEGFGEGFDDEDNAEVPAKAITEPSADEEEEEEKENVGPEPSGEAADDESKDEKEAAAKTGKKGKEGDGSPVAKKPKTLMQEIEEDARKLGLPPVDGLTEGKEIPGKKQETPKASEKQEQLSAQSGAVALPDKFEFAGKTYTLEAVKQELGEDVTEIIGALSSAIAKQMLEQAPTPKTDDFVSKSDFDNYRAEKERREWFGEVDEMVFENTGQPVNVRRLVEGQEFLQWLERQPVTVWRLANSGNADHAVKVVRLYMQGQKKAENKVADERRTSEQERQRKLHSATLRGEQGKFVSAGGNNKDDFSSGFNE